MSKRFLSEAQDKHNRLVEGAISGAVEFIASAPDMHFEFWSVYKGDLCKEGHNFPAMMLVDFMRPEALAALSVRSNFNKVVDQMIDQERPVEQRRSGEYLIISIKPTAP